LPTWWLTLREGFDCLFHHFHHDADDGLKDGTDELWALMGSGAMAAAMAVNKSQVN
jgi:hypothetical protein